MKIDEAAFARGLSLGATQALTELGRGADAIPEETKTNLRTALAEWPEQAAPRFQSLFAALTAIAAIARYVNKEPELTIDDLRAFLGHSALFFNSFKHR